MNRFDYTNIPTFNLYDDCILTEKRIGKQFREVIVHTTKTFTLSDVGELIVDENLSDIGNEYYRILWEVPDHGKYLYKVNDIVMDWDKPECMIDFLGKHNLDTYRNLKSTYQKWKDDLDIIKNSDFAQNVFKYFILVQKEFELWLNRIGIDFKESESSAIKIENTSDEDFRINDSKQPKYISLVDKKNDIIEKASSYINEKIKDLPETYIRKDIA